MALPTEGVVETPDPSPAPRPAHPRPAHPATRPPGLPVEGVIEGQVASPALSQMLQQRRYVACRNTQRRGISAEHAEMLKSAFARVMGVQDSSQLDGMFTRRPDGSFAINRRGDALIREVQKAIFPAAQHAAEVDGAFGRRSLAQLERFLTAPPPAPASAPGVRPEARPPAVALPPANPQQAATAQESSTPRPSWWRP